MDRIKIKVHGKINASLDVLEKRADGYHNLDMVMMSVDVFDVLTMTMSDKCEVYMNGVVQGEENIATRVLNICVNEFAISGGIIDIKKGIPMSAGMGGSSADASGVLYLVGKLFGIKEDRLIEVAKKVGSDVVYMLYGGCKRCEGKGEILTKLPFLSLDLVLVKPNRGARSSDVFRAFDDMNNKEQCFTEKLVNAIEAGEEIAPFMKNGLQKAGITVNEDIQIAVKELQRHCKVVLMTGSGSAVYGVCLNEKNAENVFNQVDFPLKLVIKTVENGIEEI